jgi:hypothetical protein
MNRRKKPFYLLLISTLLVLSIVPVRIEHPELIECAVVLLIALFQ